jgi:hypothetical protein
LLFDLLGWLEFAAAAAFDENERPKVRSSALVWLGWLGLH